MFSKTFIIHKAISQKQPGSELIYSTAARFVDLALRHDDSLFTPGQPIWTLANVEDLYHRFVDSPDTSNRSFLDKFKDQLQGAAAPIYQLAGELIYVHLLIATGNIGGLAKRGIITAVLSWSSQPVTIPPESDAILDYGLARVGTAYLTYRPFQLAFLLRFMRDWKRLSQQQQAQLLDDPWAFKAMLFAIPISHAYAQREALLHLVHPQTFEAIVSRDHKKSYARRFASYVSEPNTDVDRELLQIRSAIDQRYGAGRSLYTINDQLPSTKSLLPRSLGSRLSSYIALAARLDGPGYTPEDILAHYDRSSQSDSVATLPTADTLLDDLLRLRLLEPLDVDGSYRRWPHLRDGSEPLMRRYAALTMLVNDGAGGYELPILRAPLDGTAHPESAWPLGRDLIDWYVEADLVEAAGDGLWRSKANALDSVSQPGATAQAINTFLSHLQQLRDSQQELPALSDEALPVLDPSILEQRIAEICRELLIDRATIQRIYRALIAGHHIILSGPPGTGKTHLARILPGILWRDTEPTITRALATDPRKSPTEAPIQHHLYREGYSVDVVTATEDWGVRNVIGGITPQLIRQGDERKLVYQVRRGCLVRAVLRNYGIGDGDAIPLDLRRQELLLGDKHYRGRWLVIDEFTRAPIDAAFGSLLTTLGGQRSPLSVPTDDGDIEIPLPRDFRLIGTLNSFDRHFLNQISEAMKRRFTFIDILPPEPEAIAQEQAIASYRALRHLHEQGLFGKSIDPEQQEAIWEDVMTITPAPDGSYTLAFEEGPQSEAALTLDRFWRIFRAIRVYRQLGTAQAEAVCSAMFSGQLIGMPWSEALDSALADTLADQLQVMSRDEQRVLLAYLRSAEKPADFVAEVKRILSETPLARQRNHLSLLQISDPGQLSADNLGAHFVLGEDLGLPAQSLFVRRLEAFIHERGL